MHEEEFVEKGLELVAGHTDLAHPFGEQADQRGNACGEFAAVGAARSRVKTPEQIIDHLQGDLELAALLAVAQGRGSQLPQPHGEQELPHRRRHLVPLQPLADHHREPHGEFLLALRGRAPTIVAAVATDRGRRLAGGSVALQSFNQLGDMARRPGVLALDLPGHHEGP